MNQWHYEQEKEAQNRKYRDLEFRFHNLEREKDDIKRERNELKTKLENKQSELNTLKDEIILVMGEFRDKVINYY